MPSSRGPSDHAYNVLFRWRREHLRASPSLQPHVTEEAVLLPVTLSEPSVHRPEPTPPRPSAPTGVIEIELGAARVRLRGTVDEANVRSVLQALKAIA